MDPHLSVITLGVDDLERAVAFYRDGLGLPTKGIIGTEIEHGAVAFFNLRHGLKLALWPRASLTHETGISLSPGSPSAFSLGHNVNSRDEVDAIMTRARESGATILKEARESAWGGYAGYFQDPDCQLWEIVWNPDFDDL
jgi:catechol 2,3-dioxygenase-like lactoylglutathione lyase family enzyme